MEEVEFSFFKVRVSEVSNGKDVTIEFKDGLKVAFCEGHGSVAELKLRDMVVPTRGSRITVPDGRVVKVKDIKFDSMGHCFVVSDLDETIPWA